MVGVGGSWRVLGVFRGLAVFLDSFKLISRMLARAFQVQVGYADGWCWGVLGVFGGVLGGVG